MRPSPSISLFSLLALLAGCAGVPQPGSWGAHWPDAGALRDAAGDAAKNPRTWAPLTGAALLTVTGLDNDVSDWLADEAPLFGSGAARASDRLRDGAVAGYLLTALAAPSESAREKLSGLGVGIVTLYAQGMLVEGAKEVADRRRPDRSDRLSFPSGHTSTASAAALLGVRNLAYIDMPSSARTVVNLGFEGLAISTGWARVEARKHYVADVLAGYAVGHFMAAFAQSAFIDRALPGAQVRFHPIDGGGALRLTLPVSRRTTAAPHNLRRSHPF